MTWVWSLEEGYTSNEKLMLLLITAFMDSNGRIELSDNQAMEKTGIKTPEAIKNSIKRLVEKNILTWEVQGGGGLTSVYLLHLSEITLPDFLGSPRKHPPRNPHGIGTNDTNVASQNGVSSALVTETKNSLDSLVTVTYSDVLEILRKTVNYNLNGSEEDKLITWLKGKKISPDIAETVAIKFTGFYIHTKKGKGGNPDREVWCYDRATDGHKSGYYETIYGSFQRWCKIEALDVLAKSQSKPTKQNELIKDAADFAQLAQERKL